MSRDEFFVRAFFEPLAGRNLSKKEVEETIITLEQVARFVRENRDVQKMLGFRKRRKS